jgi:uncharacterized protein (DUF433 family)
MNWQEHLSSNPEILFGKLVIKGTRIPVDLILEKLAVGQTPEQLLTAYPKITISDIQACLYYAADNSKHEKILSF